MARELFSFLKRPDLRWGPLKLQWVPTVQQLVDDDLPVTSVCLYAFLACVGRTSPVLS